MSTVVKEALELFAAIKNSSDKKTEIFMILLLIADMVVEYIY